MSRIALVITSDGGRRTATISAVRRATGSPLGEITEALNIGKPVFEAVLFYNDHEQIAETLRRLVSALTGIGAQFQLYELPERQSFAGPDQSRVRPITTEVLENILVAHEKGLLEQQAAVDRELGERDD
jgi:hypothetical protein